MVLTRGVCSVVFFLLICIGFCVSKDGPNPGKMVLCKTADKKLSPLMANCTHIVFASMYTDSFSKKELKIHDWLASLLTEKKEKPNLKILVQVVDSKPNDTLKNSDIFAKNVTQFLVTNNLDGIVYTRKYTGPTEDVIKKLKETMSARNLLLLYSLRYGSLEEHPISKIAGIVDNFVLTEFDNWSTVKTTPVTPLRSEDASLPSLHGMAKYIQDQGALPSKVILPLAFKGRMYACTQQSKGVFGEEAKFQTDLSYNEICKGVEKGTRFWDEGSLTPLLRIDRPYCFRKGLCSGRHTVVTYEDPESMTRKGQYIYLNRLGGVYLATTYRDDNEGTCGKGKQPLLNAAIAAMNGGT